MPVCPHEVLVSITAHNDVETLNREFAEALKKVYSLHTIRFYTCNADKSCREINQADHPADFERLHELKKNQFTVYDGPQAKLKSYLSPVYYNRDCIAVLVLDGHIIEDSDLHLLRSFITLYANQFILLQYSNHDALTQLYNRQAFERILSRLLAEQTFPKRREDDSDRAYYFALLDIDHFKQVNDQHGHLIGDEVLLQFSRNMKNAFRQDDLLFRYGGEEFAIVLQVHDMDTAAMVLERFRHEIESCVFPQAGRLTVSIGFTRITPNLLLTTLTDRADKALYYAKQQGRNQCRCYEQLLVEGELEPVIPVDDIELF